MKIKNKRNLIIILGILFLGIGSTLAFFKNSTILDNIFNAGGYKTIAHEEFVSPSNWMPGDITPKTITVKNEGTGAVYTRICIEDYWEAPDDTILSNFSTTLNDKVALINLDNQSDWSYLRDTTNNRDCYLYNGVLEPNETTSSPIQSVTFNPAYRGTISCHDNQTTGDRVCESVSNSYDNGTYHLNLTVDTVQPEGITGAGWGIGYSGNGEDFNANSTDALDDSDYRNFLKIAVKPSGIEKQVGVRLEDTDYLLTGGDNGTSYSDNKDVLDDIFTSTNCNEVLGTPNTYTCSDATLKLEGYVDDGGNVYIIDSVTIPSQKVSIDENDNIEIKIDRTLYGVLQNEASVGTYAKEYVGDHQDSMNVSLSTKKIYHWWANNNTNGTAILDKNNVIFGGFCWQMIRTTDTGGVKLIYNGESENGKCLNTRSDHKGTLGTIDITKRLNSAYLYGDTFTYDTTNNTFTLEDNLITETWSDSTYRNLLGKYTCASEISTCTTLYQVNGYQDSNVAYVAGYTVGDAKYSQIGEGRFNSNHRSPAMVGYMYNDVYNYNVKYMENSENMLSSSSLNTSYWYAHNVAWGSPVANQYNLDNPYQVSSTADYPNLVGEYTFRNTSQTYTNTSVYYIAAVNNTTMYYITMNNTGNHILSDFNRSYTYGDSYTDNGNGTYTINNPTTINIIDWYTGYSNVGAGKYVCRKAVNNTCSDLWYTTSISATTMYYIKVSNVYKYAKSFTWDGSKYILDNATSVSFWDIVDSTNQTSLNNAHYTCWNLSGECTTISYIYALDGNKLYYINITEGKSVEDAFEEMLTSNNVNHYNSSIKGNIEAWYKKYMMPYDIYLEDVIYCNDRSIGNLGGWNPDGGNVTTDLQFKEYNETTDLSCTNEVDKFSVSNNRAKQKYKVGLITNPEMRLLNNSKIRATNVYYLFGSPKSFDHNYAYIFRVNYLGEVESSSVSNTHGVRPSVSLKPGIEYTSGDGSMVNPYIVSTE